ncbi:hypothetical protein M426DRAFT_15632 [Hypoxylon sp. CI-4A]|nr:hypothetical protein M426DRAFT_15632 [Hypoxylon sp. CI-4A]
MFLGKCAARFPKQECLRLTRLRAFADGSSINTFGRRGLQAGYSSLARQSNEGKTVIVTGSSRGIGKAIALRLALDGYDVCVNDLRANQAGCDEVVKEIKDIGRNAVTAIADVTKRDEVKQMIQTSVDTLGPLSTMIANAGIAQVKSVLDVTEEEFERMFAINVFGLQNCFAEAARQLISQGDCRPDRPGKLIAAASVAALRPIAMLPHYSASKCAARGLTHVYAQELAPHHITANAYAPGVVGTAMWDLIDEQEGRRKGLPRGEVMRKMVEEDSALGRVVQPEDVAKLVSFLASSDSDMITGQTPVVDAGMFFT